MRTGIRFRGYFTVQCFGPDGTPKWRKIARNTVLNAALDDILDVYFHDAVQTATWYMGLIDDGPLIDPTDVMLSHGGWIENDAYTGDRQEFIEAAADARSLSNSASPAVFPINDDAIIAGAFLCGAATGDDCLLFCAAEFEEGDASAEDGDTINVIYEIQAADAGV